MRGLLARIRRSQREAFVPSMREYDGGSNCHEKAVEYARWLAKRDGVKLPRNSATRVIFRKVQYHGYDKPIKQADIVFFNNVKIKIPHVGYDPTKTITQLDVFSFTQTWVPHFQKKAA